MVGSSQYSIPSVSKTGPKSGIAEENPMIMPAVAPIKARNANNPLKIINFVRKLGDLSPNPKLNLFFKVDKGFTGAYRGENLFLLLRNIFYPPMAK